MPQLFGQKLRRARRQHNLTQAELAHQLSLSSYEYISRLEAQLREPSLELVVRIAVLFDLPIDYFLLDKIGVDEKQTHTIRLLRKDDQFAQFFGQKLRALRTHYGWGQTDLSRKLGLARRGYISNLEMGRKAPSLDLVSRIADLFGVTINYLLRDDIQIQSLPPATESEAL